MRLRLVARRRYKLSPKQFLVRWFVAPFALLADALVTLVVTPFGYDSDVYHAYLGFVLRIKYD